MKDNKNCPTGCGKKIGLSSIALFAFLFLYDWLVHGMLLKDMYAQTASMWRPMEEMKAMMPYCIGFHMFLAIILASMFAKYKNYEYAACDKGTNDTQKKCQMGRGFCFGVHAGLLLGLLHASAYIMLPIPPMMAAAWFAAGLLKGILAGVILSLFYNRNSTTIA